jgi:hypothetical protein
LQATFIAVKDFPGNFEKFHGKKPGKIIGRNDENKMMNSLVI